MADGHRLLVSVDCGVEINIENYREKILEGVLNISVITDEHSNRAQQHRRLIV